jgi:hypothetical protein
MPLGRLSNIGLMKEYKKGQLITKFKTSEDHIDSFQNSALEECNNYKNENNLGPRFFCKNLSSSNYFYSEDAQESRLYPNPGGMRENKTLSFHYAELRERGSLASVRVYCKRMNQCTKNMFGGLDFSEIIAQYCVKP